MTEDGLQGVLKATAYVQPEGLDRALASVFDGHLVSSAGLEDLRSCCIA